MSDDTISLDGYAGDGIGTSSGSRTPSPPQTTATKNPSLPSALTISHLPPDDEPEACSCLICDQKHTDDALLLQFLKESERLAEKTAADTATFTPIRNANATVAAILTARQRYAETEPAVELFNRRNSMRRDQAIDAFHEDGIELDLVQYFLEEYVAVFKSNEGVRRRYTVDGDKKKLRGGWRLLEGMYGVNKASHIANFELKKAQDAANNPGDGEEKAEKVRHNFHDIDGNADDDALPPGAFEAFKMAERAYCDLKGIKSPQRLWKTRKILTEDAEADIPFTPQELQEMLARGSPPPTGGDFGRDDLLARGSPPPTDDEKADARLLPIWKEHRMFSGAYLEQVKRKEDDLSFARAFEEYTAGGDWVNPGFVEGREEDDVFSSSRTEMEVEME